ncbi:MAG: GNAT family N-acetyltransferase [Candidatus Aegiribacteria sp.]|nr:GNAT family N-acetyltransferase [Candidatus Aegiribacteria sp.]
MKLEDPLIKKTDKLVSKVFPFRSLSERLTFWAFKNQNNGLVKILIKLFGVSSLSNFWVAIDEDNNVVGTTGIYTYIKDENEAIWLAWFCVDPEQRGKGIGKKLIEYSINMAREYKKKYFRLYTSSDPNEAAAQNLYDKYGFKVIKRGKKLFYTRIYRELEL